VAASETTLPYYFGKALGLSTYSVATTATANSPGPVDTVTQGLLPLGLQCTSPCPADSFVAGQAVSFGTKFLGSINLAGNWGWLDLDGSGGSTLKNNIANGASTSFSVGQTIDTDPGQKVGPITQGLNSRFSGCPSIPDPCTGAGNPSDIPANDPCLVVVPAVDFALAAKDGSTSLTIEAFAEVYLDPTTTTGTAINGCFVSSVVGNTSSGLTSSFGPTTPPVLTN